MSDEQRFWEMPAGPELDAEISRLVFNRPLRLADRVKINDRWVDTPTWIDDWYTPEEMGAGTSAGMKPPRYSTDMAAAWGVVEKMRGRDLCMDLMCYPHGGSGWWCSFDSPLSSFRRWQARSCETAPLAICRAALQALEPAEPLERSGAAPEAG